jgi:hypothetical protein
MSDEASSLELGEESGFKDGYLKELLCGHKVKNMRVLVLNRFVYSNQGLSTNSIIGRKPYIEAIDLNL